MEKVWKRLIAVSLSLMLMFTMGLNVFAAENVEATPEDDPAVTLDEGDAVATEPESTDEIVVQEEERNRTCNYKQIKHVQGCFCISHNRE